MRRLLCIALLLVGCSKQSQEQFGELDAWMRSDKIRVLSTTAMIGDLVSEIGGERAQALTLIERGLDPHTYEIVKGDDEKIFCSDLVFANGLGLECGASLRYLLEKHKAVTYVADGVDDVIVVDGHPDPHVWTDVKLFTQCIDPIVAAFAQLDPEHRGEYELRAEILRAKLFALHGRIKEEMMQVDESRRFLLTSHDAFNYFARQYLGGVEHCISPEGLAPDAQISMADIRSVVGFLKRTDVGVIFPESNVSQQSLKKILSVCKKQGQSARISERALYGDAMGCKGESAGTYIGMMEENVKILREELQR